MVVRRTDDTVWMNGAPLMKGGMPILASSVSLANYGGTGPLIACVILQDKTVWCMPVPGGSSCSNSTFLGAGLGDSDVSSVPRQVVTAVAGPALTNVQQISTAKITGFDVGNCGLSACATTTDGKVWCWGNGSSGQLGRGDTTNAPFARPVLASAGTQLTDVAEVQVGREASCARKTDGSVWCWGTNGAGELGVSTDTPSSYYPTKVPFVGGVDATQATGLISGPDSTFCAVMKDKTVTCWGLNSAGSGGAAGAPSNIDYAAPTTVLTAAGGPPLSGVIDVANAGPASTCARTDGFDLVCWGALAGGRFAKQLTVGQTPVAGVRLAIAGDAFGGVSYIRADGMAVTSAGTQAVSCDDLP